jgi:elongation factor P
MASINTAEMRKGMAIKWKNDVCIVMETQHRTPGNLRAFIQATLRSITNGRSFDERFRSGDTVELVNVNKERWEFSYSDPSGFNFINPESYDSLVLQDDQLKDVKHYLTENQAVDITFVDGRVGEVEVPPTVVLKVTESPEGVKGDSANNVMKLATMETGFELQVPLFIKEGERIKIDTRTGKYLSRADD